MMKPVFTVAVSIGVGALSVYIARHTSGYLRPIVYSVVLGGAITYVAHRIVT